jgi:hypothetical protein
MKTALKWIVGIGCVLFGLMAFATSILGGILFLIAGAFLIPPIFDKINSGGKINRTLKIVIPVIGIFAGFMTVGISASDEVEEAMQKIEEKKKEEYSKLTQEQKDSIATAERIADSLKVVERQKEAELKRQKEIEARKKNTISARDLYANYDANEVSADQNFKNKTFYVTGIVEEIKKDFMNDIYVTLKTGQMFSYVNCYLDDEKTASELRKGQKVTFKGKCKGMVVTVVTMEDCEIAENL